MKTTVNTLGTRGDVQPYIALSSVNYLSTKLFNQLFFNLLLPSFNQCRKELLGLKPLTWRVYWSLDSPASPTPLIYGYSPVVVPRPPDWQGNQHFWLLVPGFGGKLLSRAGSVGFPGR